MGDITRVKRTCLDESRKRDREMRIMRWLEEFRTDVKFALRQLRARRRSRRSPSSRWRSGSAPTARSSRSSTPRCCGRCRTASPSGWSRSRDGPTGRRAQLRLAAQDAGLERAQPHVRADRRLHAERRRHGDGRRDGNAETVSRQWVTAEIFGVLGVTPIAGRTFLPTDEQQRANVVVLSEAFWRSRFNADPAWSAASFASTASSGPSSASCRRTSS